MVTMSKGSKQERDEAMAWLREQCPPGTTIWTVLRHRAASGMSRAIDAYTIPAKDEPRWLSYQIARLGIFRFSEKHEALMVDGAGMDMGFHLVYSLSRTLYPDGYECISRGCPSNDHTNGDRDYTPHHHNDGGYALNQRWF